ncbi:radical SAM protein [Escherichia coli]
MKRSRCIVSISIHVRCRSARCCRLRPELVRKSANTAAKLALQNRAGSRAVMEVEQVLESARKAKAAGSTRFCMGAAWKNPHERDMPYLEQMVQGVKAMGLEACMTLGTLSRSQAQRLANAGLDYYNHNLDTSPEFYGNIITTRTYQERLDTLEKVRDAGIKSVLAALWA